MSGGVCARAGVAHVSACHSEGQAPSTRRTVMSCPRWYALWSAISSASRRMVWPSPCVKGVNKSVAEEAVVTGYPAMPHSLFKRVVAGVQRRVKAKA